MSVNPIGGSCVDPRTLHRLVSRSVLTKADRIVRHQRDLRGGRALRRVRAALTRVRVRPHEPAGGATWPPGAVRGSHIRQS
jgi:hypothetical protein